MTFDDKKNDENLGIKTGNQSLRQIDDSLNSSSKHNTSYKLIYEQFNYRSGNDDKNRHLDIEISYFEKMTK